jgi:tRNA A-37 threonylcarbamoyl transferase component Bud32
MSWPTPQDYNEAMQAPWLNLSDRSLRSGKPALDFLGLPRPMTGAFASVYRLDCENRSYAIKLFLRKIPDQQMRYEELSAAINSKELMYTVGFQYQPEGIKIRGTDYPILKMEWVEGENLDMFVANHVSEHRTMTLLLHHFRKMVNRLQQYGVAHGDLQHGNILVKDAELKLVDYDGMYVPRLRTYVSNELGHPNYQLPTRTGRHFGPYLDNFSAWSIHTSLLCLSIDPSLWEKLSGGDDCLLFRRSDFEEPLASPAFRLLEDHTSDQIKDSAKLLRYMLMYPPEQVPNLDENLVNVKQLPAIKESKLAEPLSIAESIKAAAGKASAEKPSAGGSGLPDWMQSDQSSSPKSIKRATNTVAEWPRFEQYKQAVADAKFSFEDPELKEGRFIPEKKGLGTNGFVFHMKCGDRHVAVKCFKRFIPDRQLRFEKIAKHINGAARRYFIDFRYLPHGIRVGEFWYPILVMDWVNTTLGEYIHNQLRFGAKLGSLSERFKTMVNALQTLGIAHGDLEPDNLAIVQGDFKLLDYDGMYVPEMEGMQGIERGHPAFQHPSRKASDFGPKLDYFAAWLLDAELTYLKIDPELWLQAEIRAQNAAKGPTEMGEMTFIEVHPSKQVRLTADVLRKLLDYDFETLPPFNARIPIFTIVK